jgi:hypothetical protein
LVYRRIHTTLFHCVVPFCDAIFITKLCATWGLKLDSKDVQGRVGHENGSEYGTITPNGNTQHFISNM